MSDYTIYLTDEEVAWIQELQEETGAKSRSKVLRDALREYRKIAMSTTHRETNNGD